MKKLLLIILFTYSSILLFSQSNYDNRFENFELLGFDFAQVDFSKIDSSILELETEGINAYFWGNYLIDSYIENSQFQEYLSQITDSRFLVIGMYKVENEAPVGRVVINDNTLSQNQVSLLKFEIERILNSDYPFEGQEVINVLNRSIRRMIVSSNEFYNEEVNGYDDRNKNIDLRDPEDGSIVDSLRELTKKTYLISLSGIPFELDAGTFVEFTNGNLLNPLLSPEDVIYQRGTVLCFMIGDKMYKATGKKEGDIVYFAGYVYRNENENLEYFNKPNLSNLSVLDVVLGIYSNPCGYLDIKEFAYEPVWTDIYTPYGYGGELRSQNEINSHLKKYVSYKFHQGQFSYTKERIDYHESQLLPIKCDYYIGQGDLNSLLVDAVGDISFFTHTNGSRSTVFRTSKGVMQYYSDADGDHYLLYDASRRKWTEMEVGNPSTFMKDMDKLAEHAISDLFIGITAVGVVYVSFGGPLVAEALWPIWGELVGVFIDVGVAAATFIVSEDEKGLVLDVAMAAIPGAIAARRLIKAYNSSKIIKSGLKNLPSVTHEVSSLSYKARKAARQNSSVSNVVTIIKKADGTKLKVNYNEFGSILKNDLNFTDDLIDKLSKDIDLLGPDYYILLEIDNVKTWNVLKNSLDSRISALATDVPQLEKFTGIVKSNNLGLDEVSLGNLMNAKTATHNLPWEHPDKIIDAVKRASDANIDAVTIKGFPTPAEGNTSFVLNNAKQYQLEASGDALLSFDKGGRSFDNVTPDGMLIDRKYGHGSSVFNADGTVHNSTRAQSILNQGQAQINAAGGTPVKWEISTELGADGIQNLFDNAGIDIEVIHVAQQTIIN